MIQRIQMGAIVVRDGRIMLLRPQIGAPWELPGGALTEDQEDVDQAMDAILSALGVNTPAIEDDFLETVYIPEVGGQVVYNLYAASEWTGDPFAAHGIGLGWFALDEIEAVAMDDIIRNAILVAFGVREPAPERIPFLEADAPAEPVLQPTPLPELKIPVANVEEPLAAPAVVASVETADAEAAAGESVSGAVSLGSEPQVVAPVATIAHHQPPARIRGLDVLRTLSGGDAAAAAERMRRNYPELADAVVDFALGEVWSSDTLARRDRSLLVVAMLAALGGKTGPLRSHINGALNHGAKPEEIVETLRMVAVYAGFPAALEAWPIMEAVFEQRGIERPGRAT